MTKVEFRERVTAHRADHKRGAPPYPADMKAFAVQFARKEVADGGTVTSAARELGISDITMINWMKATKPTGAFARVVVQAPQELRGPTRLLLRTPTGYVVEGLDVPAAAALLQALR